MVYLTAADCEDYVTRRRLEGIKPGTINRELTVLSAALNYVRFRKGWNVPNPVRGTKLRAPKPRVRWLTPEEAERLIDVTRTRFRGAPLLPAFIILALNTGMRKSELLGLRWDRVSEQERVVRLDASETKDKDHNMIPLNARAMAAIGELKAFRELLGHT